MSLSCLIDVVVVGWEVGGSTGPWDTSWAGLLLLEHHSTRQEGLGSSAPTLRHLSCAAACTSLYLSL